MADKFDFNPDLTEIDEEPKKLPKIEILPPDESHKFQTVVTNTDSTVSYNKMVEMTKQHIADDKQVREEMQELTGILDDSMHQMSIKELLEYYKIKLKEREFHNKAIFDAYNFVQKSELSREMLIGSDRRERVNQTVSSKRLSKLMGYLNLNNRIKDGD